MSHLNGTQIIGTYILSEAKAKPLQSIYTKVRFSKFYTRTIIAAKKNIYKYIFFILPLKQSK